MTQQHRERSPNWQTRAITPQPRSLSIKKFRVEVTSGRDQGLVAVNEGTELAIGTAPGNQLILTEPSVSRHHVVIEATEQGFLLRDLDSTNGTFLAGHRVERAYIEAGSVVHLGTVAIRFDFEDAEMSEAIDESPRFGDVYGTSAKMRRVFTLLRKVADSNSTVLITGETGTGKGALAHSLHSLSPRRDKPFMVVDCSAIPPSLIESELFGHERGAFTGADQTRIGVFEAANGGTVFLDEIGELGLELQPKLLRLLENRQLRRVGGTQDIDLDIRIVAATNRDLRTEVNHGNFRSDLLYRLNVLHVMLPALRERPDDIPGLCETFFREFTANPAAEPPAELIHKLMRQHFPGNVRELRAAVERFVVLGSVGDSNGSSMGGLKLQGELDFTLSYREAKEKAVGAWERRYIPELVDRYDGNLSRAARAVRMDRNHLRKLLRSVQSTEESTDPRHN